LPTAAPFARMPTAFNQLSRANSTKDLTGNIPPRRNTGGQLWISLATGCPACFAARVMGSAELAVFSA
jgi:hypothetical protein